MRNAATPALLVFSMVTLGCARPERRYERPATVAATASAVDVVREEVDVHPDQLEWGPAAEDLPAGARVAVLHGNPEAREIFVLRFHMPDGYQFPPHRHSCAERVTVVQGTMLLATGEELELSAARSFPQGSFVAIPAGMPHSAWAQGETVLQVTAVGPLDIVLLDEEGRELPASQ